VERTFTATPQKTVSEIASSVFSFGNTRGRPAPSKRKGGRKRNRKCDEVFPNKKMSRRERPYFFAEGGSIPFIRR
jgi:hypothetical protein